MSLFSRPWCFCLKLPTLSAPKLRLRGFSTSTTQSGGNARDTLSEIHGQFDLTLTEESGVRGNRRLSCLSRATKILVSEFAHSALSATATGGIVGFQLPAGSSAVGAQWHMNGTLAGRAWLLQSSIRSASARATVRPTRTSDMHLRTLDKDK